MTFLNRFPNYCRTRAGRLAPAWIVARLVLAAASPAAIPAAVAAAPALQHLAAEHVGAGQGVFAQAEDGTVLVSQEAGRPVHPASVTKVATTMALLDTLGPQHRFATELRAAARPRAGQLSGNLVVRSGGDPFFVAENALMLLRRLNALGVHTVSGRLQVEGPLVFNWRPDPSGERLARAFRGLDAAEAWAALGEPPARLRKISLRFENGRAPTVSGRDDDLLATHESPPLRFIVKALNGYSNNVFHTLSDAIGGPRAVERRVRAKLPAGETDEVTFTNAAGAGESNRLSPRAAVAVLWQLRDVLRRFDLDYPAVLPVNSVDSGTLLERLTAPAYARRVVGKTGTFGSVGASALVGVLRSPARGLVAFAVLNSWVPVPEARRRQDAFVRALIDATGAVAWEYTPEHKPIFAEARVR